MNDTSGPKVRLWTMRPWLLLVTTGVPVAILIATGLLSPADARTDDGYPLRPFMFAMAGFFLLSGLGLVIVLWAVNRRRLILLNDGLPGTAVIQSVEETGTYINNLPVLKLGLLVNDGFRTPFEVVHKESFPLLAIPGLQPGKTVEVRVHPRNPRKILLLV